MSLGLFRQSVEVRNIHGLSLRNVTYVASHLYRYMTQVTSFYCDKRRDSTVHKIWILWYISYICTTQNLFKMIQWVLLLRCWKTWHFSVTYTSLLVLLAYRLAYDSLYTNVARIFRRKGVRGDFPKVVWYVGSRHKRTRIQKRKRKFLFANSSLLFL